MGDLIKNSQVVTLDIDLNAERKRIGSRIVELRDEKNIEAKVLAQKAKIDSANLCRIEKGKYSVGLDILSKIAYSLDMKIDFVSIKHQWEKNQRYRDKYTAEASLEYKKKMSKLEKDKEYKRDDSFHNHIAYNHIMYKLDTLVSEDGNLGYEFLIEYNIKDPTVGIYYGCKGLIYDDNDDIRIKELDEQWTKLKPTVCKILNNTFPDKDFTFRFKPTDNANDHTYWPFWITLNEDEDIIEVAARATKLIRNIFKYELNLKDKVSNVDIQGKILKTVTAFTNDAYDAAILKLKKIAIQSNKINNADKLVESFNKFINGLDNSKRIYRDYRYEYAWGITGELETNKDFAFLVAAFFDFVRSERYIETTRNEIYWGCFTSIILSKNGDYFGDNLAKTYNNSNSDSDFEELKEKYKKLLLEILSLG